MRDNINNKNIQVSYLILRLTMGLNMLAHGLVRLPKLDKFSSWMTGLFENSFIPLFLVQPFAYILPIAEFIVGAMLIVGFKTSKALQAGGLIIMTLVFGSCLIEKWDMVGGQMLYALFFFILAVFAQQNHYSLDTVFLSRKK